MYCLTEDSTTVVGKEHSSTQILSQQAARQLAIRDDSCALLIRFQSPKLWKCTEADPQAG
jgi:hypothetical protein